jgi:phosphopantothenoylcysteine decarboxylase/phosphopantothenate--cysteine ligase
MKKKILITAGSTWVKLDDVRVVTNIFTGKTGVAIAEKLSLAGHNVVLLLGEGGASVKQHKNLKVIKFRFFNELKKNLQEEIKKKYDVLIATAAVSDYLPEKILKGKQKSGIENLTIKFKPAPKLLQLVRNMDKKIKIVQFKLESNCSKKQLFQRALKSLENNNSDYCVANISENILKKYILDKTGFCLCCLNTQDELIEHLQQIL